MESDWNSKTFPNTYGKENSRISLRSWSEMIMESKNFDIEEITCINKQILFFILIIDCISILFLIYTIYDCVQICFRKRFQDRSESIEIVERISSRNLKQKSKRKSSKI
ncbi:TBC1 domain family member 15 [Sarcoptes scabiei]|nr:TBC1 domain family member 15 [Sarcoptes scabiei]